MISEVSNTIKTRISQVSLRDDGILFIDIAKEEQFTIDDMKELIEAAKEIGGGKKFLNLIIVGHNTLPDKEARELSTSSEGSIYKLADAFVISSLAQALIANFYLKINKPVVPTKFFKTETDAIAWLHGLK